MTPESPLPIDPDDLKRVWETLAAAGVGERALQDAGAEGVDALARMIARYLLFPGTRRYTPPEVYQRSGVPEETARSLWRAMGFPEVPDDEAAFTDADVEALQLAITLFDLAGMERSIVLQQARSMSQATARIAASHQDVIAEIVRLGEPASAAVRAVTLAEQTLPILDRLLVYMYRRHLAAAAEQRLMLGRDAEGGVNVSVGFADLTGFTVLSQELDVRDLAELIERFNASTANVVAEAGGRVIKTIGDEVMFSTLTPAAAASIGITLLDAVSNDGLPPLRVGIASGVVIAREGDLFGPPVNLASRLVATARPDTILVDAPTHDALEQDPRFSLSPLTRLRLKGLGHVRAFRLRAAVTPREAATRNTRRASS